ncbi:VOC family protein [Pullulanibacillus camelliae]|nr:VOC family protein [Pullulanibacillus camelliae]
MHLVLNAVDQQFFMADADEGQGSAIELALVFSDKEEAKQVFSRLSDGGKVLMPFEKMFWGTMFGRLEDPFGIRWQIATEE